MEAGCAGFHGSNNDTVGGVIGSIVTRVNDMMAV